MDVANEAEIILRAAGYKTWHLPDSSSSAMCFENQSVIGFFHWFQSGDDLLRLWEAAQKEVLSRHIAALRLAGLKAWNVYSVFVAPSATPPQALAIERIEEDFTLTRKIARAGIKTSRDLEHTLLPLLAIKARTFLEDVNVEQRLRQRLKDVPFDALSAFLGEATAADVARILGADA